MLENYEVSSEDLFISGVTSSLSSRLLRYFSSPSRSTIKFFCLCASCAILLHSSFSFDSF